MKCYGRKFVWLHQNRVCLTLVILIQIYSLSYVTHQYHFAIFACNLCISTWHPLHNPNVVTSKTFSKVVPPNYTTKFPINFHTVGRQPHNLNKFSTTNHQQRSKSIFILSNYEETPKVIQQHYSHSLAPTIPIPNPNSRINLNHPSGPTSNSKKKPTSYNCNLYKPPPRLAPPTIQNKKNSNISKLKRHR